MRLDEERESENVEDRRGSRGPKMLVGGGLGVVALMVIGFFLGIDPRDLINQVGQPEAGPAGPAVPRTPEEERQASSVKRVLATTEDVWTQVFRDQGKTYRLPKLVLFTGAVASACGNADAAVGPFYCPADQKVYIDLGFYEELARKFKAPGEFAQAYVIAHEIGHHVQNLMGTSEKVSRLQRQVGTEDAILQACLLRFRPITMTTMAALLGGLPLALGAGTGSELRRPLGIAIVGGLIFSQMLTLYTTPVVYLYLDRLRLRWEKVRRPRAAARDLSHEPAA